MDPQKNHGLGTALLRSVLDQEARSSGLQESWVDGCRVIPEFWLGDYFYRSGRKTGCFSDIGIVGSSKLGEKSISPRKDTGYHPTFVEF